MPVALATDVNPGGGFSPSMPFAMTLACFGMGLTFEEALVGRDDQRRRLARPRTIASAASSPASSSTPCWSTGPAINLLRVNAQPIQAVFKKGVVVVRRMTRM